VALEVASAAVAKRRSVDVDVDVGVCCMAPEQERNQPSLRLATDHPSSTRSRIGEAHVCAFVVGAGYPTGYISAHRDTAEETRAMMRWFHDPFSHRVRSLRAPSHGVSHDPRSERVDGRRDMQ